MKELNLGYPQLQYILKSKCSSNICNGFLELKYNLVRGLAN